MTPKKDTRRILGWFVHRLPVDYWNLGYAVYRDFAARWVGLWIGALYVHRRFDPAPRWLRRAFMEDSHDWIRHHTR